VTDVRSLSKREYGKTRVHCPVTVSLQARIEDPTQAPASSVSFSNTQAYQPLWYNPQVKYYYPPPKD